MDIDGKAFNKPAIAIWGEKDTWVPLSQMQPIADQIPSIKIIVIEGAGHCPMATHADQFNNQLLHFLDPNYKADKVSSLTPDFNPGTSPCAGNCPGVPSTRPGNCPEVPSIHIP
jgi:hypothetical protein